MIEGRAQCFDVSKLGLSDLKVTIFHPFCRAEDKENQDRSVTQLDQSSKTRQKLNQNICKIDWSYILMPGTVWQILNCLKFTHFIPESEILRSCFPVSETPEVGGQGGHVPPKNFGYQLTLSGPRGADYARYITTGPPHLFGRCGVSESKYPVLQ